MLLAAVVAACAAFVSPARAADGVHTYTEGVAGAPFSFVNLDPALSVGTSGDPTLQFVLPVARDMPFTSFATTRALTLGDASEDKEYLSLLWGSTAPRGANVFVSYSVDGGAWLPAVGPQGFDVPRGTHGRTIAYRVSLTTSDPDSTPTFAFMSVEYTRWTGDPTDPDPGGGGGSSHKPGASHKPGSGSFTYPPSPSDASGSGPSSGSGGSSGGSPGGSWTGGSSGGGSGASGSGGSGSGSGPSTSGGASSPQTPVSPATVAPAVTVPSPPASEPGGPPVTVTGLPADGDALITGTPFVPEGGASGGGSPPVAAAGGFSFPLVPAALVTSGLALLVFVPWAVSASRLRSITGYDFERARRAGPFPLLRR